MISNERASTYSLGCNICLRQIIYKVVAVFAVFPILNFLGKCLYSEKPTKVLCNFKKLCLINMKLEYDKYEARKWSSLSCQLWSEIRKGESIEAIYRSERELLCSYVIPLTLVIAHSLFIQAPFLKTLTPKMHFIWTNSAFCHTEKLQKWSRILKFNSVKAFSESHCKKQFSNAVGNNFGIIKKGDNIQVFWSHYLSSIVNGISVPL